MLWEVDDDSDVVDGKEPGPAVNAALEPVIVDTSQQRDLVSLAERKLHVGLRLEVVQRLGTRTAAGAATCTPTTHHILSSPPPIH